MFILLYHPDAEECWSHDILRCHGMSNKYNFLELCQELRFSLHRQANALYYNSCSSQIYIFRINSFKSLAKANKVPPSISCLLWPDISLQTKTRSWLVWKEDIFQGILDNQAHTSHHALPSEYPVHFLPHLFLRGRSPISDDIFHIIPFHCCVHYSQHSSIWETSKDEERWKT